MMRFATWKVVSIIIGTLLAVLIVIPSLLPPETRASLDRSLPLSVETIVLGLDLQGGAHLLLEVDSASVTKTQVDSLRDDVRRLLREDNIKLTGGIGVQSPRRAVPRPRRGRSRQDGATAAQSVAPRREAH